MGMNKQFKFFYPPLGSQISGNFTIRWSVVFDCYLFITLLLGLSFILYTTPQAFSFKTYHVEIKAIYLSKLVIKK